MADHDRPPRYHAYLLRCWQERSNDSERRGVWRFSLEDPHTGVRAGFATLEALTAALRDRCAIDEDRLFTRHLPDDSAPLTGSD